MMTIIMTSYATVRASLVAQMVKNLPAMQDTQVQSLGWEGSLEKGMATHSSICVCRIPWTSPGKNAGVGGHSLLQESSQPRDQTWVSSIARRFFTI